MKIISKYKDFYDYLVQDNDSDLVYVRKPFFVDDTLLKYINIESIYHKRYYYNNMPDIDIDCMVFGIYPYIYLSPYIKIKYTGSVKSNQYFYVYFLTKEDIENIKTGKDIGILAKQKIDEYINVINKHSIIQYFPLNDYTYKTWTKDIGKFIKEKYYKKQENKEVFYHINSPVFCEWDSNIIDSEPYYNVRNSDRSNVDFICNCSFDKLGIQIMRIWFEEIYSLNTYTNIENFLWASKQEPIANPDNNIKIIAHGFDTKDSFRNTNNRLK